MSKMKEFDNILNECVGRLIEGESIEACLSRYPEYAAELEPLLRTAQDTLKATAVNPRPGFRQRAAYQFQAAIREMPVKERRGFFSVLRPSLVTIITLVVVLLAGGGTVMAAGNSLPDSPLYQVKLATEAVRLALTPSDLGKAELNAHFADERVDEIIGMAEKGNAALIEETTDRMNEQLIAVANLTGTEVASMGDARFSAMQAPAPVTVTPMPTVPAPVPTPTPTVEPTPPVVTPAPTIVGPPEEGLLGGAKNSEEESLNGREAGTKDEGDRQEKLEDSLTRQYIENMQALQDELEKAPESLKPSLRRAIEVAVKAYEEALENLGS
jgi:hypothetical protein